LEEFDEQMLLPEIKEMPNFQLEKIAWRTILGKIKDVKFSMFYYKYFLLYPTKKFRGIKIADVRDIAAMKIAAIASRGTKRDFVDLYFISKEKLSLKEVFRLYDKKFKNFDSMKMHIMKSLIYFDDAESDEMPRMLKEADWKGIKKYFENEVRRRVIG